MLGTAHLRAAAGFLLTVLLCLSVVAPFASASFTVAQDKPERRTIPVSVVDKEGNFVEGLTAENFRGKFRRKSVKILSIEENVEPARLVILVDVSGSMREPLGFLRSQVLDISRQAVSEFAKLTTSGHEIILASFAETMEVHSQGHNAAFKILEVFDTEVASTLKQKQEGKTHLYDSLLETLELLIPVRPGDSILLITDGDDNSSKASSKVVEQRLAEAGVRLFALWLPVGFDQRQRVLLFGSENRRVSSLAEKTGGQFVVFGHRNYPSLSRNQLEYGYKGEQYTLLRSKGVSKRVHSVVESVKHYYQVVVELPCEVDKPRKWKLEVVDERGKKMKGVKVLYPRLLVPLEESPEE